MAHRGKVKELLPGEGESRLSLEEMDLFPGAMVSLPSWKNWLGWPVLRDWERVEKSSQETELSHRGHGAPT